LKRKVEKMNNSDLAMKEAGLRRKIVELRGKLDELVADAQVHDR